jgi:hypothetical protein
MSEENVSLPVAQALASALEKIEAYVPTEYVDNSEPDIDAEHLNHAEQGIMRVTNLLNAAVDVIQGQESRLADAETKIGTAALTGGMTDLSSGLNTLNSNLTPSKITDVTNAINTTYGSGNVSYHTVGKVCFVYFVFTPNQKCDNVELIGNGILPLAKDSLYHSISTWGNPDVAVSLVQTITTGGLRFWCGESAKGMQIFDSFSYCVK